MASAVSAVVPAARKRRKTPKARTGCLTCRQRHVKCDERKPVCQRCENVRIGCKGLGYGSCILAKPYAAAPSQQGHRNLLSKTLSEGLPSNELDSRYIQLFRAYSAADLSGYFQSEFWSRFLLQQSHFDPSIRDAIIAIGALYKSIEVGQNSKVYIDAKSDYLEHFRSALSHYQRAIYSQRKVIEVRQSLSRTSLISCLIACLLFICFEALHGDQESVIQQIICGIHLLNAYDPPSTNGKYYLSDRIDGELSQIFARLDVQIRFIEDGRPQQYSLPHMSLKLPSSSYQSLQSNLQTDGQPSSITGSLEEARLSWDLLLPRILHVRQMAEPYRYSSQQDVPSNIIMGVKRLTNELLSWRAVFDFLFHKSWNDISEKNRLGASAIRISYHFAYIKISTSFELEESLYDSFLVDFQEIVRLSRFLIKSKRPSLFQKITFSLDSVVGVPLFVTGMKCRDRRLRREASALLAFPERREGMWDSAMAASIINWVISVEEAGLEPHQAVPECNRVRMLDFKCNLQKRSAWVRCGQHVHGAKDYANFRELSFTY